MALSSMTGFARSHGVCGPYAWAWEVKSVNGKGLDLRLRLPPSWDAIEVPVRSRAAETLARGSVQANLTVERSGALPVVRVNAAVLDAVLATAKQLAKRVDMSPPSLDGLLALKGVMEVTEAEETEEERRGAEAAVIAGFASVIAPLPRCAGMRAKRSAESCWRDSAKLAHWPNAPTTRRAVSLRPYGRDSPSSSQRFCLNPIVSIPTDCIRRRS